MESIVDTFHIDWQVMLAQTVNFCLVAFVLWRFVWKPIGATIAERDEKINAGLKMAEESKTNLVEAKEEAKKIVVEARSESLKIAERSLKEAEVLRKIEIDKSKTEAYKIIETGKRSLLAEKENILKAFQREMAELLSLATKSILKEIASPETDKILADKILKNESKS